MEIVVCNDFDDCSTDNLQNRNSIISFDESESCSVHYRGYADKEGYGVFTELHSLPASCTTFV
jgi:hypothetical protein